MFRSCLLSVRSLIHSVSILDSLLTMPNYAHLLPPSWKAKITEWIHEDIPSFDYGGFVVGESPKEAILYCKKDGSSVLAGVPFFDEVFKQLECRCV